MVLFSHSLYKFDIIFMKKKRQKNLSQNMNDIISYEKAML